MGSPEKTAVARLQNALGRVKTAEARAADARRELRRMLHDDINTGRVSKAEIARAFGVSQRRIRQMLNTED